MANGDRDYWKDRYEQEVLGKPKPKEYTVEGFVTVDKIVADTMKYLETKLIKKVKK